ncbi:hypothetical protein CPLU01_15944 [Colletotrichum plurivorum]|uniref:ABM domain-containing protein n=1 Tax=Colletotrichum plurivorum TaxID=2175906 RepID=A0A8H6MRX7_9PEZI|nr:hypothetical protein CPLU01_15944 [Colletotrichum plurivorum]
MADSTCETVFIITLYFAPVDVPKFLEMAMPIFDKVQSEPDFLYYEMYHAHDDPGAISFLEKWSKPADWLMQNQLTKEYYKEYLAVTERMYVKPREMKILNLMGSKYSFQRS